MPRLPLIPTIVVALAVATMIGLGLWQLQRAEQKEALIARYAAAQDLPPIAFPTAPAANEDLPLFRYATAVCLQAVRTRVTAGRNQAGETGYAHIVDCSTGAEGPGMSVEVGWSRNPNAPIDWAGGPVSGVIAPDREMRIRLVAATPAPGLAPSAPPSMEQIPNNHLSYAIQWFAFAIIALVIYFLALRWRTDRRDAR